MDTFYARSRMSAKHDSQSQEVCLNFDESLRQKCFFQQVLKSPPTLNKAAVAKYSLFSEERLEDKLLLSIFVLGCLKRKIWRWLSGPIFSMFIISFDEEKQLQPLPYFLCDTTAGFSALIANSTRKFGSFIPISDFTCWLTP